MSKGFIDHKDFDKTVQLFDIKNFSEYLYDGPSAQTGVKLYAKNDVLNNEYKNQWVFNTPILSLPWDVKFSEFQPTIIKSFKVRLNGSFNNDEWSGSSDKINNFCKVINDFEDSIFNFMLSSKEKRETFLIKCLKYPKSKVDSIKVEDLKEKSKRSIEFSYDDETGKKKPYDPQMLFRFQIKEDMYQTKIYNKEKTELTDKFNEDKEDIINYLTRGTEVIASIVPSLWFKGSGAKSEMFFHWKMQQIRIVKVPIAASNTCDLDDSDIEEEVQEPPQNSTMLLEDSDESDEDSD